ncbi:hypothetical protein LV85_02197 [Algoriphagus chordae]|uniref:Uncharacterized protein n=1 Tax=Algoriphagus chordae TaxID=237019 RepID=A0A2W7R8P5_9BACT|nr:hypothetical protein LV85_02197 [Algoriphagus chordae]
MSTSVLYASSKPDFLELYSDLFFMFSSYRLADLAVLSASKPFSITPQQAKSYKSR